MSYTGRRIKFASGKSLRFSKKKKLQNSSFRIHFYCFLFLVFIPGSAERIYKSPTAIFSQPIFLTNIWTALFEKETLKPKPPRLTFSKMPKIYKDTSAEISCVHFRRLLDLLWHDLKKSQELRILRKSCKNRDFFLEQVWSSGRRILIFFSCAIICLKFLYSGNPLSI